MSNVKFDYCGGCGLQRSLVLRGDSYKCMRCIAKNNDSNYGDFKGQEAREMELQSHV